jgi:hypothetical protein
MNKRDDLNNHGARLAYVNGMLRHRERLANIKPVVQFEPPKAAFGGGKYRTPQKSTRAAYKREEYTEVREAFRRILMSKPAVHNHIEPWKIEMGERLSRNRRLNTDRYVQLQHAKTLQVMHKRIQETHSLAARRTNKLDAELYPVLIMRKSLSATPGELWRAEAARRAASPKRPASAPRERAASPARRAEVAARPASARGSRPVRAAAAAPRPATARAAGGGHAAASASGRSGGAARTASAARSRPQSARQSGEASAADGALPDAALGQPKAGRLPLLPSGKTARHLPLLLPPSL